VIRAESRAKRTLRITMPPACPRRRKDDRSGIANEADVSKGYWPFN
jgi:hypothetical protein